MRCVDYVEKAHSRLTLFKKHDREIRTASTHDDKHPQYGDKHTSAQHLRTGHQLQYNHASSILRHQWQCNTCHQHPAHTSWWHTSHALHHPVHRRVTFKTAVLASLSVCTTQCRVTWPTCVFIIVNWEFWNKNFQCEWGVRNIDPRTLAILCQYQKYTVDKSK